MITNSIFTEQSEEPCSQGHRKCGRISSKGYGFIKTVALFAQVLILHKSHSW